jgi:UDP-2-acetamido-2-deoxy-ribo-hexuluronate aminotransferase
MEKIQLVDLKSQYARIENEINEAVLNVIKSTAFINGPDVKAFADELQEYVGVKHAIPCANGTDALQIALMALDLKAGDEIITPSFTYIATAEVIALLGLKAVFVEVNPNTFTLDPASVERMITPKTKAIIAVHLYGHCADMESILNIANKHNIAVIEDNAQAIGADYTFSNGKKMKAGAMGTIGCTSFFPSKNLGCYGDGGAIFTQNDELAQKLRMIANHGQSKKYYHDVIGCNSRLDTIQAAILRIKLRELNDYIARRQKAAAMYNERFAAYNEISTPYIANFSSHVFHQYTLKLAESVDRDGLITYLNDNDIPANIYYPVPIHRQKGFLNVDRSQDDLSITDKLTEQVISLPMHTELSTEQIEFITNHIIKFINKQ